MLAKHLQLLVAVIRKQRHGHGAVSLKSILREHTNTLFFRNEQKKIIKLTVFKQNYWCPIKIELSRQKRGQAFRQVPKVSNFSGPSPFNLGDSGRKFLRPFGSKRPEVERFTFHSSLFTQIRAPA